MKNTSFGPAQVVAKEAYRRPVQRSHKWNELITHLCATSPARLAYRVLPPRLRKTLALQNVRKRGWRCGGPLFPSVNHNIRCALRGEGVSSWPVESDKQIKSRVRQPIRLMASQLPLYCNYGVSAGCARVSYVHLSAAPILPGEVKGRPMTLDHQFALVLL